MKDEDKTKGQLIDELADLRQRIGELEVLETERRRAEEELRRYAERLCILHEIDQAILEARSPEAIAQAALRHIRQLVPCLRASVAMFDLEVDEATVLAVHVDGETRVGARERTSLEDFGLTGGLCQGKVHVLEDLSTLSPLAPLEQALLTEGIRSVVKVPLIARDELIGALQLGADSPAAFAPEHVEIARELAGPLAITIRQVRLYQEIQHRVEELAFLNRVGRAVTSSLDLEEILTTVMEETAHVLGVEAGSISLLDEERGELVFGAAAGPQSEKVKGLRLPLDQGIAGWVARESQRLLVPDVREDPRFYPGIDEATGFVTKSVLAVPLKVKGKVIGVIEAVNKVEGYFSQADVALLSSMAQWAAIAVENAQLFEETRWRFEEMAALYHVSLDITAQLEMPELLKSIVGRAVNLLGADAGGIYLYDPGREELRLAVGYDYTEEYVGTTLKPEEGMAGRVFQTGEPLIVDDYRTWEGRAPVYEASQPFTAALEVPLKWQDRIIGVLAINADAQERTFNRNDVWLAMLFANQASIALENARLYQAAQQELAERRRAERLLQALNQAALAMGQALTPEEMFAAVADELKKLGFFCAVFLTDESQSRLFLKYLSYEVGAIRAAEKLVGIKIEDFSIPIETVNLYRDAIRGKKASFLENAAEDIMWQVLPESVKRFARQIAKMMKIPKSIAAPLIVEDEAIGVFSVQSDDLTEEDVPAITAFAHQMAAAWRKAQLMQDLQSSLEELKRTQDQLLQAQKMEAIGQLAAGIAHDFNNLLTPIGGFAELLLGKAPEDSQQQEYLRHIKVAAGRAAALTRQLRLLARQAVGDRHPLQLNSAVEEIRDLLERSIPKEIAIELHLASELWAVEADPSQIGQVLMNLCLNACDAMPDGGTLTLKTGNVILDDEYARTVVEARPGRYVRLSVSDTGCGMSPEVQARLFEPFFTTKEVGEGTGLGLSVVYGIVKGHGGFIQVYSQERRGSTFHVYLPAIEAAVEEREVEGLELPSGKETVLLVDDEEAVRVLGQRVLEGCGYAVLMAENGLQAVETYQAHRGEIALVVLDVVMPRMGGQECLRRLREMDPQVKVLISTGYTAHNTAQKLVADGALGIVEKPFLPQDFAVAVRATLDKA